jgi:hypothetical protein
LGRAVWRRAAGRAAHVARGAWPQSVGGLSSGATLGQVREVYHG